MQRRRRKKSVARAAHAPSRASFGALAESSDNRWRSRGRDRQPAGRVRSSEKRTRAIHISIRDQELVLKDGRRKLRSYSISSSRFGLGTKEGSMKTPLGKFRVSEKIGDGAAPGT